MSTASSISSSSSCSNIPFVSERDSILATKDCLDVYISTKDVDENGPIVEAIQLSHRLIQQGYTVCLIENRKLESNKRFSFDQILLAKLVVIMATDDYGARNTSSRAELKFIVEARKPSLLIKMVDKLSFNSMEGVNIIDWMRGEDKSIQVAMIVNDKLQSISLHMVHQVYNDGVYFGNLRNGMKHGFGYYIWVHTGERYQGDWFMDKRSGFGVMSWADGRRYVGGWREDLFDGPAVQTCVDGSKYEGTWKEGHPNGVGVYTTKDGTKIEGIFVNSTWSIQDKVGQLGRTVKALSKKVTNGGIEITGIDSRNLNEI